MPDQINESQQVTCWYIIVNFLPGYSPELCQAFIDWDPSGLNALEDKLISSFCNTDRCWREGHLKSSFNYLLLDPRVTKNLPNRMHSLGKYIYSKQ